MITLQARVTYLTNVFNKLQNTTSRLIKDNIVSTIDSDYREDFDYCIECIAGKHKFGYKLEKVGSVKVNIENASVKSVLIFLQSPYNDRNLTNENIILYEATVEKYYDFFAPIVNRTLRLGIGGSLLSKTDLSPMLAKKFEGSIANSAGGYYITEKLDGNRCLASYDGEKWNFTSRNGKQMHVNFDMTGFDTDIIYDGEVLSPEQVNLSRGIYSNIVYNKQFTPDGKAEFNGTSGLINRHDSNKNLVYNIFDIVSSAKYKERRDYIDSIKLTQNDVRILPILAYYETADALTAHSGDILDKVNGFGGEGLMINLADSSYLHKRTEQLLKYKPVYTIDMKVYDCEEGSGKYEGCVGALLAAYHGNDKDIRCSVGTGLSDYQRKHWYTCPEDIIGKIIEVSYFSMSQTDSNKGTSTYSLRFPRLKRVREDKTTTSAD